VQQLSALDTLFLSLESDTTYGHACSLAIVDPATAPGGRLRAGDLKRVIDERGHLLPPLRRRLVEMPFGLDRPYWTDADELDLDAHVHTVTLRGLTDDRALAETVSRLAARQLDRSRPLWELHLIEGLEGGRAALLTKIHHALIDGMSGAEIMGLLYDLAPEGREIEPDPEPAAPLGPRPGALGLLRRGLTGAVAHPVRALGAAARLLPAVEAVPLLVRPEHRAPRVPFSGRISADRRFAFGSLPLADVKAVKNKHGVKVNDVVVALSAAAIRRWLEQQDALPDEPLLAQIPVSVRTEEQRGTYGNRIGIMIVPIPTDEPDATQRLRTAHEHLSVAKDRHDALPAAALQDVTEFLPPAIAARSTRVALQLSASRALRPLYNVVISNVPGPPVPIYLAGALLEHSYPVSVIADGSGLNITVVSYREHLDIGVIACPQQVPDPETIVAAMRDELAALVAG
jgi:diacylglycerol O-acyltransferase